MKSNWHSRCQGLEPTSKIYNALFRLYARCGDVDSLSLPVFVLNKLADIVTLFKAAESHHVTPQTLLAILSALKANVLV